MGLESLMGVAASLLGGMAGGGAGGGGGGLMPGFGAGGDSSSITTTTKVAINSPFQVGGKGNSAGGQTADVAPTERADGSYGASGGTVTIEEKWLWIGGGVLALLAVVFLLRK